MYFTQPSSTALTGTVHIYAHSSLYTETTVLEYKFIDPLLQRHDSRIIYLYIGLNCLSCSPFCDIVTRIRGLVSDFVVLCYVGPTMCAV
jgi:hypothetical protein